MAVGMWAVFVGGLLMGMRLLFKEDSTFSIYVRIGVCLSVGIFSFLAVALNFKNWNLAGLTTAFSSCMETEPTLAGDIDLTNRTDRWTAASRTRQMSLAAYRRSQRPQHIERSSANLTPAMGTSDFSAAPDLPS
eukprot:TRINITY_DN39019_c0_g1_i1.p1 TRINITY_DN39019_c0_g1~~TRINITY_DN39019_c0_g1_i1.p1  ORF type:complete len:143 (-),score=14.47 TRINITY_DN39019_c0_g1_i1:43-444(-)